MIVVPQEIEDALWTAARARLGRGASDRRALVSAIIARSLLYTSERDQLSSAAGTSRSDLAARALFFTVADAAKVALPLAELSHRQLLPTRRPLRIVDVGAGVGAMSLGALGYFARHGWPAAASGAHIIAIDRDAEALRLMSDALAALPPAWRAGVDLETRTASIGARPLANKSADLILAGTVFNELDDMAQDAFVEPLIHALADDGALIIIEPALRETSRALLRLRDRVITAGLATVFAPCTRTSAPCPALAEQRDWCHEDRRVLLPRRTRQLSEATGLRQDGLKFSYLVLRRGPEHLADQPPDDRRALRIVSQPRKLKGRRECFACGDHGRTRVRLLKRNRTVDQKPFLKAMRGDLIVVGASDELGDAPVTRTRIAPLAHEQ